MLNYLRENYHNKLKTAFLSTYTPRECGIATYTKDLVDSVSNLNILKQSSIIVINDRNGYYNYESEVKFQIVKENVESYIRAAEYVNNSDIDVINLQHEFGLFGGDWGRHITTFLKRVEKPVITTLHTVLLNPEPKTRKIIEDILLNSEYVVVMAKLGIKILTDLFQNLAEKVRYIPHGCPNLPFTESTEIKQILGLNDRIVLSTFGLLSEGKGVEYAINALPEIVKENPKILYLIIGQTHPEVRKNEGERYRKRLINLVEILGLEENVRFVNKFLPKKELIRLLQATDIYIIPYPNREQISSGTLLHALSTGKAIISTPFLHAEEVISEGCAIKCEFKNSRSITDCVKTLLLENYVRRSLEEKAYKFSREMVWPKVAIKYVNLFAQAQFKVQETQKVTPLLKVPANTVIADMY